MSAFKDVLIVGAGTYGASTALELARLGNRVTVLDRSSDGYVATNGASSDLNKIIRADYDDANYRDLAKKSIHLWRTNPLYAPFYHETGVFFRSGSKVDADPAWLTNGIANAESKASNSSTVRADSDLKRVIELRTSQQATDLYPAAVRAALGEAFQFEGQVGYFNPQGGWAEALNATKAVLDEAKRLGAQVLPNAEVVSLVYAPGKDEVTKKPRVTGVRTADGRTHLADVVVLATGSWSTHLLQQLHLGTEPNLFRPSAHCVLTIKIDPSVGKKYQNTPVTFNASTGFYSFAPNNDYILKCATHSKGDDEPLPQSCSTVAFPEAADHPLVAQMIGEIHSLYPEIKLEGPGKNASIHFTRICWYNDTLDENLLIDYHPDVDGLVVASGDSGHAFKFLPMIGRLIASRVLGIYSDDSDVPEFGLSRHQRRVFSFSHHLGINTGKIQLAPIDSIRISALYAQKQAPDSPSKLKAKL